MAQSRLDQELLALEMFGFFARARSVPGSSRQVWEVLLRSAVGGRADLILLTASIAARDPGCVETLLLCHDFLVDSAGEAERRFVEQADRGQWTLLPECLNPLAMRQRRETVEHPFGTMNARMGGTHFLTRTLPKVAAEMALSVLA